MPEADTQEHYVAAPCCNAAATFDQDFGFFERIENFAVEQLISQFAVKCFVVSIFPRATGFDEQRPVPSRLGVLSQPLIFFAVRKMRPPLDITLGSIELGTHDLRYRIHFATLISAVSRDGIGDIQPSAHESTERSLIV